MSTIFFLRTLFSLILIMAIHMTVLTQWFKSSFPVNRRLSMIESNGGSVFVGTREFPSMSHLYRSMNGLPWDIADSGITMIRASVEAMSFSTNAIFGVTSGDGVWRSTNGGTYWEESITGSGYKTFMASISIITPQSDAEYIFCAANAEGVYRSTDYGGSWRVLNTGLTQKWINSFATQDSFLFAGVPLIGGASKGCIYRTSDYGESWKAVTNGLTDSATRALAVTPFGILMATGYKGVYLSTDHGDQWYPVNNGLLNDTVLSLAALGSTVFAGTHGGGVYISTDSCRNWHEINEGLPSRKIISLLACTSTKLYAESYPDTGLWMRPISQVVSVEAGSNPVPDQYQLDQNYPNPFNPSTSISYSIPMRTFVTMRVFDLLGREVVTLVSGVRSPGQYEARWDAESMPSGVYLCRLETDRSTQVRRMLLVR